MDAQGARCEIDLSEAGAMQKLVVQGVSVEGKNFKIGPAFCLKDQRVDGLYGQTHEIANLYCAGPGIFATAGASNPTYTIFALSQRGAEHLAKNWSTIAG